LITSESPFDSLIRSTLSTTARSLVNFSQSTHPTRQASPALPAPHPSTFYPSPVSTSTPLHSSRVSSRTLPFPFFPSLLVLSFFPFLVVPKLTLSRPALLLPSAKLSMKKRGCSGSSLKHISHRTCVPSFLLSLVLLLLPTSLAL
jgi:hypothetical protein